MPNEEKYLCFNKFYGRALDAEGLETLLHTFLPNNSEFKKHILDQIIEKLQTILTVVSNLDTYRFYSSSLLFVYDLTGVDTSKTAVVSNTIETCLPLENTVPDLLPNQGAQKYESDIFSLELRIDQKCLDHLSTDLSQSTSTTKGTNHPKEATREHLFGNCVDVRMIDFAHFTCDGFMDDQIVHKGPDDGFLFGLKKLIGMFQTIKEDMSSKE